MDENYYRELLKRYLENRCNPKELEEIVDFLQKQSSNRSLLLQMKEQFDNSENRNSTISSEQSNRIRETLLQKINATPVIASPNRSWKPVVAAAAIIILIVTGLYLLINDRVDTKTGIAKNQVTNTPYKNDLPPGGNKALLTLADGSTIALDDAQNGTLANQGNTKVIKLNGKLDYSATSLATKQILYNTISTPRGGQYQIGLPGGSQVWLNAASSLRFPTTFAGNERSVEITGQAYFEVAPLTLKPGQRKVPFIVKIKTASGDGGQVEVLGTHFDVMAYTDEASLKTTLLEGSVKFIKNNSTNILKPGQQSQLFKNRQIKVLSGIDVDKVIAWKNGIFDFEGADIGSVMRQLSRWYDVEVVYDKKTEDLFYAEIPRNTKLSDVLKALELTGKVHFAIEGRRIIVMP